MYNSNQKSYIYNSVIKQFFLQDPRFNPAVDKDTGYRTHSILCMPIKNQDSEVSLFIYIRLAF